MNISTVPNPVRVAVATTVVAILAVGAVGLADNDHPSRSTVPDAPTAHPLNRHPRLPRRPHHERRQGDARPVSGGLPLNSPLDRSCLDPIDSDAAVGRPPVWAHTWRQ